MTGKKQSTPNDRLRAARQRLASPTRPGQPMSRPELADAVNAYLSTRSRRVIDGNYIGKLERGDHRWPSALYREAFRAVLHVGTDRALGFFIVRGQGSPAARPQPRGGTGGETGRRSSDISKLVGAAWFGMLPAELAELPGPWTAAMDVPARIEAPHVEALTRSIALFEDWDHRHGGGLARAAMIGQFEWVCRVSRQSLATEKIGKSWQSTAARLGDLAGWACFDAGDCPELAERHFLAAIQLATEADDGQQRVHTATSLSRHLTYRGRVGEALEAIGLARLGWRQLSPLGRTVINIVEARAYAKLHDEEACRQSVDLCDDSFAAISVDEAEDPTWGYYADEGQILGDAGHALFDLAVISTDEKFVDATIARLENAYSRHPDGTSRSKALTMIRIASLKARHWGIGDALDAAERGLADARHVRSRRVLDDLRQLDNLLRTRADRAGGSDPLRGVRDGITELIRAGA